MSHAQKIPAGRPFSTATLAVDATRWQNAFCAQTLFLLTRFVFLNDLFVFV